MTDFKELHFDDFWCRYIEYDNGDVGIMLPFRDNWITIAGTKDELGELGIRLAAVVAKLESQEIPPNT